MPSTWLFQYAHVPVSYRLVSLGQWFHCCAHIQKSCLVTLDSRLSTYLPIHYSRCTNVTRRNNPMRHCLLRARCKVARMSEPDCFTQHLFEGSKYYITVMLIQHLKFNHRQGTLTCIYVHPSQQHMRKSISLHDLTSAIQRDTWHCWMTFQRVCWETKSWSNTLWMGQQTPSYAQGCTDTLGKQRWHTILNTASICTWYWRRHDELILFAKVWHSHTFLLTRQHAHNHEFTRP